MKWFNYPKYKIAQDRDWDFKFTAKVKHSWRDDWEHIEREKRESGSMSRYRAPAVTYSSKEEAEIAVEKYHDRVIAIKQAIKIKEATPRYSGEYKVKGYGSLTIESEESRDSETERDY